MTRSTRLTLILLIVGMFVLSAFADRASAGAAQEGKVVSDFSLLVGAGDFYTLPIYAMMRDYATRYNLRLRRADITGGGLGAQMFAGGTGDILVIGFQGAIRLAETQTVDVTILGQTSYANVWNVVAKAGSPIRSLRDVKGKRVGITAFGSLTDCQIRYELLKIGLDPKKDVQLLALGDGPSQLAALVVENTDTAVQASPYLATLLNKGEVQLVFDARTAKFTANVIVARTKAIQANPTAYGNFMKAYREAIHKIATDPRYATDIATYVWGTKFSAEDIQTQLKDYINNYWNLDGAMSREDFGRGKEMLIKCGASREDSFPSYDKLTEHAPK